MRESAVNNQNKNNSRKSETFCRSFELVSPTIKTKNSFKLFERSGINLMADSQYNGETRVQVLLEYIQVYTTNEISK